MTLHLSPTGCEAHNHHGRQRASFLHFPFMPTFLILVCRRPATKSLQVSSRREVPPYQATYLNPAIGSACHDYVSRESLLHRSRWATAQSVPPGTCKPRVQFISASAQATPSSSTSGEDEARVASASAHQSSHSHSPGQVKITSLGGSCSTSCTFQPS